MGARASADKTVVVASSARLRERIRKHDFAQLGGRVVVSTHTRDLGAHLSVGERRAGTTATVRMRKAEQACRMLKWINSPFENKVRCVTGKIIPSAIY
eukprot:9368604-Alexandrium_andersonii.AAC.1